MNAYRVLALLGLLLLPTQVFAQKTLVDLDTAAGNYSTWKVTELGSNSVEFTATYVALKKHEQWAPSYTFKLGNSSSKEFAIFGSFQGSEVPRAESKLFEGEKEIKSLGPILTLLVARPTRVRISWSGTTAAIEVDGMRKVYEIGFAPTSIEAICSTGELELKDITFGK
jgi:hypothetical protein